MSSDAPVTFLTQEAFDRLNAELEHLSTVGREEIAKRLGEPAHRHWRGCETRGCAHWRTTWLKGAGN